MLVHGFRGDHHGLEAIAAGLSDFDVVIPDLPGYGRSAAFEGRHDLETYSSWLVELNESIGCDIIAGHSFGSLVVAKAGDALGASGLVLINPVASKSAESRSLANRVARAYYRLAAGSAGSLLLRNQIAVRAMSVALTTSPKPQLRSWIHASHHRYFSNFSQDRVAIEGFWAAAENSTRDYGPLIKTQTLVVAAEKDQISTLQEVSALHAELADSELATLAGVGHLLHYERPSEVAQLISQFATLMPNERND